MSSRHNYKDNTRSGTSSALALAESGGHVGGDSDPVDEDREQGRNERTKQFQFEILNDVYFPLGTKSVDIAHWLESVHINLDYFVLNKPGLQRECFQFIRVHILLISISFSWQINISSSNIDTV